VVESFTSAAMVITWVGLDDINLFNTEVWLNANYLNVVGVVLNNYLGESVIVSYWL
jgi:hypothetical protein